MHNAEHIYIYIYWSSALWYMIQMNWESSMGVLDTKIEVVVDNMNRLCIQMSPYQLINSFNRFVYVSSEVDSSYIDLVYFNNDDHVRDA